MLNWCNHTLKSRSRYATVVFLLILGLVACGSKDNSQTTTPPQATASIADAAAQAESNEIETLFNRSCVSCHLSGVANAPRSGDVAEWQRRIKTQGMDQLVAHVRQGLGAMPPMGMCNDCSDEDFQALIEWMATAK